MDSDICIIQSTFSSPLGRKKEYSYMFTAKSLQSTKTFYLIGYEFYPSAGKGDSGSDPLEIKPKAIRATINQR